MKKHCTICGCSYDSIYTFKTGHVCEDCIKMLKSDFHSGVHVRIRNLS